MLFQSFWRNKCIIALVAFIWLFPILSLQMVPQTVCPRRRKVTLITLVGLFSFAWRKYWRKEIVEYTVNTFLLHCWLILFSLFCARSWTWKSESFGYNINRAIFGEWLNFPVMCIFVFVRNTEMLSPVSKYVSTRSLGALRAPTSR